jgi:hypothetical protein
MTITFKSLFTAFLSLVLPGLGQMFHGAWGWAIFWLVTGVITGGLVTWLAAIHCLFLTKK